MQSPSPTRPARSALVHALIATLLLASVVHAQVGLWPRQFASTSGTFVVYQPQPEEMSGNALTARAAFSLQKPDASTPTFGVLWFQARVAVDRDRSTVTESDLDVTKVRLPGASESEAKRYEHLVEAEATGWDLSGSLEELQAGLAASAKERLSVEDLAHVPPRIVFSTHRAILVNYDGPPELEDIDGSRLQRVANTPYAVVFDPRGGGYFLSGANVWYEARNPLGPWSVISGPPAEVAAVVPPDTVADDRFTGGAPTVITATEPTELVVTDGEPLLAPLVDDRLFYVTNTECDMLRDQKTQSIYLLLSGRWFSAKSQAGPWTYVPADQLPDVFQQIAVDSPKGNVLANVAGTDEADDAVADNEIPQTSAVARDDHDASVEWDGVPQFQAVPGTGLQYGLNTDAEVIFADGRYFLCDQGVWYVANDPNGPWTVSDVRPVGLDDIPPSCPVYNVRYVEIFSETPDVIEVGYLPGYLGYYPCRGTIVYGSGYRYRPWRGRHHFYPRPCTWGFHARYNPWLSRWSFGYSYGSGFLRIGLRWHPGRDGGRSHRSPWLGPGGFHRPLLAEDRTMIRLRPARVQTRFKDTTPANLYTRSENVRRLAKPGISPPHPRVIGAGSPAPVPNDVFAGKDGNVYRRPPDGGWRVRQGKQWVPTPMPATPSPPLVPRDGHGGGGPPPGTPGGFRRPPAQPVPAVPAEPNMPPSHQPQPGRMPVQPAPPPAMPPRGSSPMPGFRQPAPQPMPPRLSPTPGALERDFRARERASSPPPQVRPAQPPRPAPEHKEEPKRHGR